MLSSVRLSQLALTSLPAAASVWEAVPVPPEQSQQRQTSASGCCQCLKCMAWIFLWQILNYFHWPKEVPENGPWESSPSLGDKVSFHGLSALSRHTGCTGKSDPGKQETNFRRLVKIMSWNIWMWSLRSEHSPSRGQKESRPWERSIAWMIVSLVMPKRHSMASADRWISLPHSTPIPEQRNIRGRSLVCLSEPCSDFPGSLICFPCSLGLEPDCVWTVNASRCSQSLGGGGGQRHARL